MRNKIRIIGVSLASMAGILLVSGVAWAQTETTPIEFRIVNCQTLEEPEREWVDEHGIEHASDATYSCRRSRDVVVTEVGLLGWDSNPATGDYFERGRYAFTGRVLGELATGVGRYRVRCNTVEGVETCTSFDVMYLDGGGRVRSSATWDDGEPIFYSGILLDMPGGPGPRR